MHELNNIQEAHYLDVISVNLWQILISLANLLILFLIIKKFLYKPIKRVLSERENEIGDIYGKANAANTEANENRIKYEEKLNSAQNEAEEILTIARQRAEQKSNNLIEDATREVNSIMQNAKERIEREKQAAKEDLINEISSISLSIAEKVIEREINDKDHEKLIGSFIEGISD